MAKVPALPGVGEIPNEDDWKLEQAQKIRARLEELGVQRKRNYPLTKQRREILLLAVAAGATVTNACEIAQVPHSTVMKERRRNPEFAQQWQDALDVSVSALEERMEFIFLHGPLDSVATVNAGKTLLAARSSRYNDRAPRSASASIEAPGGGKMTVHIGTPGPD